jgi:hypothetical protein
VPGARGWYRDGKLELEGFPVADISDYLADGSVTIWLDLRGPDHDDLAVLSEEFGLHPLPACRARVRRGCGLMSARSTTTAISPGRRIKDLIVWREENI